MHAHPHTKGIRRNPSGRGVPAALADSGGRRREAPSTAAEAPVVGGAAAGLTTLQMGGDGQGLALGGTIGRDSAQSANVAVTSDYGKSWKPGGRPAMPGPVYGSALVPAAAGLVVAVGPRGIVWSHNWGASWRVGDTLSHWAVAFTGTDAGWAVGPAGRVTRLSFREP